VGQPHRLPLLRPLICSAAIRWVIVTDAAEPPPPLLANTSRLGVLTIPDDVRRMLEKIVGCSALVVRVPVLQVDVDDMVPERCDEDLPTNFWRKAAEEQILGHLVLGTILDGSLDARL
jgi:hypothetical protein